MPAVGLMVVNFIEGWRVLDTEGPVGVLAMKTLLVPVHHGLPVESPGVLDRTAMWQSTEVVP